MWSPLHVRWGNLPHVTSPTWGPPPSCKQALTLERFHSRGQHLCKFVGTKESVYMWKEFISHWIVLEHQYGCREDMWKRSILWVSLGNRARKKNTRGILSPWHHFEMHCIFHSPTLRLNLGQLTLKFTFKAGNRNIRVIALFMSSLLILLFTFCFGA